MTYLTVSIGTSALERGIYFGPGKRRQSKHRTTANRCAVIKCAKNCWESFL